jgi:hypothetical protein
MMTDQRRFLTVVQPFRQQRACELEAPIHVHSKNGRCGYQQKFNKLLSGRFHGISALRIDVSILPDDPTFLSVEQAKNGWRRANLPLAHFPTTATISLLSHWRCEPLTQ